MGKPVRILIVRTSGHHQHNMNLQQGDLVALCQTRSLMIKLAQDGKEEAKCSHNLSFLTFTLWGIFLIYKARFTNLLLILGIKSHFFPHQGLIFQEIKDLEMGKSADKYLFRLFSAFICSPIMNFPYVV